MDGRHRGGGDLTVRAARRRTPPLALPLAVLLALSACREEGAPAWQQADGHRWRELRVPEGRGPGFTPLRPSRTGVEFVNALSEQRMVENRILMNGSGVAIGDVDGDGRVDIYLARLDGPNALYRNLGDWRFEEVEGAAGAALADRSSSGAVFADADGDGDLDLFVTVLDGPNAFFLNDGRGRFRDVATEAGVGSERAGETAALADIDGDGDLDLYVVNYKRRGLRDRHPPGELSFERVVERTEDGYRIRPRFAEDFELAWRGDRPLHREIAEPDELYLNDGRGRFREASWTDGRFLDEEGRPPSEAPRDWGLAARFHDVDGDGDPDLYVCNDLHSPDRFWLNDGSGTFRAVGPLSVRKTPASCMAVDFSDIDRDGDLDLFGAEMLSRDSRYRKTQDIAFPPPSSPPGEIATTIQVPRNVLLVNRGDGTWTEAAQLAGVAASEWSWSALFLDVDLDGYEDLLIPNGHIRDILDTDTFLGVQGMALDDHRRSTLLYPELRRANVAFRNRGDLSFEDVSTAWGFGRERDVSHGIAAGDLDGDGDLDLVVNRLGDPALLLRNDAGAPRVGVRLRGRAPNTAGVGSVVVLRGGAVAEQRNEVTAGGLYLSGSEPLVVFAAGRTGAEQGMGMELEVRWRSGRRGVIRGVRPNRLYEVEEPGEGAAPARDDPGPEVREPFFEDVSERLGHAHVETPYRDAGRQPLIPYRPSQLGPGMAWEDFDRDGDPDLVVGTGAGGRLALLRNDGGRFRPLGTGLPEMELDLTGIVGLPGDGRVSLLVGQSNYEAGTPAAAIGVPSVLRVALGPGAAPLGDSLAAAVPGAPSATGPLALGDVDGDGDLDLFVGGRVVPAAYPAPASSRLFRNEAAEWREDVEVGRRFSSLGLVSAAIFSDVDVDGDPDLLLALEWGPIRLFENRGGRFVERTDAWGLAGWTSRWNGLAAGDLDGDGRPDLVATSWGRNTGYELGSEGPLLSYYGDFDGNGTLDVVEARHDPRIGDAAPLLGFERLSRGLPYVRSRIGTFAAYGDASVEDVLGPAARAADRLEAHALDHVVWMNRGDRFEAVPLPREAQLAPAFYAGVADFDGDGHEDVFLAQNFYATHPAVPRLDAGRGLWLRGDGRGGLEPVPGDASGVAVYGDQRGAALADFDGDGRVDLAVSQNGARTRLFRNRGARPGLRVRLVGPPGNPRGIGAAVRVVYTDGSMGPAREVRAGSGYWSQDDPVQVLGLRDEAATVRVRWPGGETTETPVEPGTREVRPRFDDGG